MIDMIKKSSVEIIRDFLASKKVSLDIEKYLDDLIIASICCKELPNDLVDKIIADAHMASSDIIKKISDELAGDYKIFLGNVQREQLKKFVDYGNEHDYETFVQLLQEEIKPKEMRKICEQFSKESPDEREKAVQEYLFNLKNAIRQDNKSRIRDYLVFVYSRLVAMNEKGKISMRDIFLENSLAMEKDLPAAEYKKLLDVCNSSKKEDRFHMINKFNIEYLRILDQIGNKHEKSGVIYLNITQDLFDKYPKKKKFYSSLFSFIKTAYANIQNHKSLVIKIENIIDDKLNIKWEIYSYLVIFAEKFNKIEEPRRYYSPEATCADFFKHRFKINLTDKELVLLKKYYNKEISFERIADLQAFNVDDAKNIIDDFAHIYTGFTFIDCDILLSNKKFQNTAEIEFIQNTNELLLIFIKHSIDDMKIPCPICGSLKISGNSFPEIGIRSWECRNPLCSDRSKTNRGKRYSARTILMQGSNLDFSPENTIPREIIRKWRRDIVENWDLSSLYKMMTKYYSYVDDMVTAVNAEDPNIFKNIAKKEKRKFTEWSYDDFVGKVDETLFESFFESDDFSFLSHFTYEKKIQTKDNLPFKTELRNAGNTRFVLGDCADVLQTLVLEPLVTIHNMVTSPPYYNAREYSQWENLYQYLNEMYYIIQRSYRVLQKGGVFFFNIGDTFDNEKIIVKSKMGEKRIPLGAYITLLFKKAGFEILDNIVWNKGEPQSNRHKNDGNFTPYYQRQANCYEHIFIFKKPGAKIKLNEKLKEKAIPNNVRRFSPVYKIVSGGINTYGHSAPFPRDIPEMSTLCFTNESEIILDPFSGSGTTVIVAAKNGRIGIGIEKDEKFIELSVEKAKNAGLKADVISFESPRIVKHVRKRVC